MSDTLDKMQKTLAAATFAELDFPRQLPPKTTRRELLSLFRSSLQNLKNQIAQAENVFALLSRGIPHTERPEMTMHRQQMKAALNHAASQATMQVAVESDRSLHRSLGLAIQQVCRAVGRYVTSVLTGFWQQGIVAEFALHRHDMFSIKTTLPYSSDKDAEATLNDAFDGMDYRQEFDLGDGIDEFDAMFQQDFDDVVEDQEIEPEQPNTNAGGMFHHTKEAFITVEKTVGEVTTRIGKWRTVHSVISSAPRSWRSSFALLSGTQVSEYILPIDSGQVVEEDVVLDEKEILVLRFFDFALVYWHPGDEKVGDHASRQITWPTAGTRANNLVVFALVLLGVCLLINHWWNTTSTPLPTQTPDVDKALIDPRSMIKDDLDASLEDLEKYFE